jgi:SAM-dependent methyltransferase
MASFVCNLCGAENSYSGQPFEREKPSCRGCGSSVRTRGLMAALSIELFGMPIGLPDFPIVKSLRGLGTSDSSQYANRLAEVFDYRNTFFDREPRFDLGAAAEESDKYDFLVSSDVFEHVRHPVEQAFRNAYQMLKPNGVLVFTVPYEIEDADEHFPDLHEYGLAEVGGGSVLVNRTKSGEIQVAENLSFHLSGTGKSLEMRVFSEKTLRAALLAAGFTDIRIHKENYRQFGIVPAEAWSLPIAARKGPVAFGVDALRDVMEDRANLLRQRAELGASLWHRIGRKLGFN